MKIAVASNNNQASSHFGHCEGFEIYEVEEGKVVNKSFTPNPGHKPGFLPVFLKDMGVNVVIAGGMGAAAHELFSQNKIEVVVGVEGTTDDLVQKYIKGELKSTDSFCQH